MKTLPLLTLACCTALFACGEGEDPAPEDNSGRLLQALGLGTPSGGGDRLGASPGAGNGLGTRPGPGDGLAGSAGGGDALGTDGDSGDGGFCSAAVDRLVECGLIDPDERAGSVRECGAFEQGAGPAERAAIRACLPLGCAAFINCLEEL